MDEIEQRLAALELLAIETLARWPDVRLAELARDLAAPEPVDADEKAIRAQAVQLVEDARGRYEPFNLGAGVQRPRPGGK